MFKRNLILSLISCNFLFNLAFIHAQSARNPVIFADVPDMSMIRVGDVYYMSSTTMHMSPGLPIMKSEDLVNWEIINYAYDILDDVNALNLGNGKNAYGGGSWASCLRYHDGVYYVSTFSGTTNKTYIYTTNDIERGPWDAISFAPAYHDHTLFFDDDGRIYMIWGVGKLMIAESDVPVEMERIPLTQKTVFLKAECNFKDRADIAKFYYSLDEKLWKPIGSPLKMAYTIPHFMGYRFGLFNYATQNTGGYVDFDYFQIKERTGRGNNPE